MNWDLILNENFAEAVGFIAVCSCAAVFGWVVQRRKEREAFYRSEAIKKIAEMPISPPEPVLALLRQAVESWKPNPRIMPPAQAKAYYRSETLKKIAEMQGAGAANSLIAYLREEDQVSQRRQRDGMMLGGTICVAVGIALAIMLWIMVPSPPNPPTYPVGFIPLVVGIVLLLSAQRLARRPDSRTSD
jgi:hypothetical protein